MNTLVGSDTKTAAPRLPVLNRYLTVWILAAMAVGLALGRMVPSLGTALAGMSVAGVSVPIAFGLLVMMYRLFLADLPEYRTGVIIVGLARCIAMVIVWNDLACGDREAAAVLVALNAVFQIVAFGALSWFYLVGLPGWLGWEQAVVEVTFTDISLSVLVFLGVPLLAGYLTRRLSEWARGRDWYEYRLLPKLGPWGLYGLLFTIVALFALQGEAITSRPWDVARIAIPLLLYFVLMWGSTLLLARLWGFGYSRSVTLAFTAAGNNFELAIAVAIASFGAASGQALAGVVGPLIEVPVLLALVHLALAVRRFFPDERPQYVER